MPQSYLVCRTDELKDGDRRVMSCDGTEVGVFKVDGQLVAWHNECPHRGGPVCQGRMYKRVLEPVDGDGHVRALAYDETSPTSCARGTATSSISRPASIRASDKIKLRRVKLEEKDGHVYVVV